MSEQITGLAETLAALSRAPESIADCLFPSALQAAIDEVAKELQSRCPDGEEDDLATHVITVVGAGGAKGHAACGFSSQPDERGVPIDSKALWVEYGHRELSHAEKLVGEVAAHPFMRPAAVASEKAAVQAFIENLSNGLAGIGNL